MKRSIQLLLFILFFSYKGFAQDSNAQKSMQDSSAYSKTSLDLSLNSYMQAKQPIILSPSVSFRYSHLYSSLRYNYEALHTASIAAGYRFEGGDKAWYGITPIFGFSFGDYTGVSPELLTSFGVGNFMLAIDGEYSISFTDSVKNLFLLWAGAYYVITPWLFTGVTFQRSRLFSPMKYVDAGIAVGVAPGSFDITFQANRFWNSGAYFQIGVSYFLNPQKSDRRDGMPPVAEPVIPENK